MHVAIRSGKTEQLLFYIGSGRFGHLFPLNKLNHRWKNAFFIYLHCLCVTQTCVWWSVSFEHKYAKKFKSGTYKANALLSVFHYNPVIFIIKSSTFSHSLFHSMMLHTCPIRAHLNLTVNFVWQRKKCKPVTSTLAMATDATRKAILYLCICLPNGLCVSVTRSVKTPLNDILDSPL